MAFEFCLFFAFILLSTAACKKQPENKEVPPKEESARANEAVVVELFVKTKDELPFRTLHQAADLFAGRVILMESPAPCVILSDNIVQVLEKGTDDPSVKIFDSIRNVEDIKFILIEHIEYEGIGRTGSFSTVTFARTLPPFPKRQLKEPLTYSAFGEESFPEDTIPWPDSFVWGWTDNNLLELGGAESTVLKSGESFSLPVLNETVSVTMEYYPPEKKGGQKASASDEPALEDLGKVLFQSWITIKNHGVLPIRGEQR